MFEYIKVTEKLDYDGSQLSPHFAYRNFKKLGDSIVYFRGACDIPYENMVDLEDVINHDSIYSKNMAHVIAEFFDLDLIHTIMTQRLLASIICEDILLETGKTLRRDGDDIFFSDKKLSISIATTTGVSSMFHFAMNLSSDDTPVDTISLFELGIEDVDAFMDRIIQNLKKELRGIKDAKCKVTPR